MCLESSKNAYDIIEYSYHNFSNHGLSWKEFVVTCVVLELMTD